MITFMIERIGLKHFLPFDVDEQFDSLKRNLLFFDRIGIAHLQDQIDLLRENPKWIPNAQNLANQLDWMVKNKLIFEVKDDDLKVPGVDTAGQFIELFALSNQLMHQSSNIFMDLLKIARDTCQY